MIVACVLLTSKYLCVERVRFARNDAASVATVMFAVKGAVLVPLVVAGGGMRSLAVYGSGPIMALTLLLALACTVYGYLMMTRWQPHVTSTQAGIIYATEPVFASCWALFLPGLFSAYVGVAYENERIHWPLLAGGVLILAANALLILRPNQPPHGDPAPIT